MAPLYSVVVGSNDKSQYSKKHRNSLMYMSIFRAQCTLRVYSSTLANATKNRPEWDIELFAVVTSNAFTQSNFADKNIHKYLFLNIKFLRSINLEGKQIYLLTLLAGLNPAMPPRPRPHQPIPNRIPLRLFRRLLDQNRITTGMIEFAQIGIKIMRITRRIRRRRQPH